MEPPAALTLADLHALKARGERIAMLTCYDAATAELQEEGGVDVSFVGDSIAQVVLGYATTAELPLEEMLAHVRSVARARRRAYLLADLPFVASGSVEAVSVAATAFRAAGADGLKFEGPHPELVSPILAAGLDAWGHLGYTPQTLTKPVLQARDHATAEALLADAQALVAAGIGGLVVELVPPSVGERLSQVLPVPVIGIGAGENTDGQVQVWQDLIGWSPQRFRHAWRFAETRTAAADAIRQFRERLGRDS